MYIESITFVKTVSSQNFYLYLNSFENILNI